jgi:hypothetical protein
MTYTAKTLISGYKLGLEKPDWYIGIPKQYWNSICASVKYEDKVRIFDKKKIVKEETFPDKFTPGKEYTLCYVMWSKNK